MGDTVTGSGLLVYINGQIFARCTGFSFKSTQNYKTIMHLDSSEPAEFMPTTTSISGNLKCIRTSGDGGLEGLGVSCSFENFTRLKGFSLMVIDRKINLPILKVQNCVSSNQQWGVDAKGIMTGGFEFEGFDWKNETPD